MSIQFAAALFLISTMLWGEAAPPADKLTVLYTGKLLGYARVPDVQWGTQTGWLVEGKVQPLEDARNKECSRPGAACQKVYEMKARGAESDVAKELLKMIEVERQAAGHTPLLLVGTGDNFAMDYFSRVVVAENWDGSQEYVAKDELFYLDHDRVWVTLRGLRPGISFNRIREFQWGGDTLVPEDNVAAFFRQARYDALVPGKHDFYYGPERVRQLARLAAEGGTHMLGANLIFKTQPAVPEVAVTEQVLVKKRNFVKEVGEMKWSLPKTVLPWARTFRLKNAETQAGKLVSEVGRFCETDKRDEVPTGCSVKIKAKREGDDFVFALPDAKPTPSERTYLVCATLLKPADAKKPEICQAVDVSTPFFQYPDEKAPSYEGNKWMARSGGRRMGVKAYVVKNGVVVMGVVEAGLESLVGSLNTTYVDGNPKLDTMVVTMDPGEALKQLLEYCKSQGDCAEGTPMVLLAQMPRDEAAILNDRMEKRYALVVSQADGRFPTSSHKVEYAAGHRPMTVVPDELISPDAKKTGRRVHLNVAELQGLRNGASLITRGPVEASMAGNGLQPCTELSAAVGMAWTKATGAVGTARPDEATRFRTVVLDALRRALKTDVALVQERDFYDLKNRLGGCQTTPVSTKDGILRASVEQILWKGDYAISRTISGASLKAVWKESKRLKSIEDNSYQPELESKKWLQTLGIWQDPETQTLYVNGVAIEDKALYSVAMTDFLASGDTGYIDLKIPAVPPAARPRDLGTLMRVSEAVMEKLGVPQTEEKVHASTYLDQTKHGAFPSTAAAGLTEQVLAILLGLGQKRPKLKETTDKLGQTRAYTRFFLDKGEFGYNEYRHNMTTQDHLNANFAGTTQSGVLSPQASTYSLGLQWEARRELPAYHFFARNEIDYKRTKTQQSGADGSFLPSFPANQVRFESGIRSTFRGTMRSRPWDGFLLSGYAETNLHEPFADGLTAGVMGCTPTSDKVCPTTVTFRSELPRTTRVLAKGGFRRENEKNWIEAGLFAGMVNRPVDFLVQEDMVNLAQGLVCRQTDLVTVDATSGKYKPAALNDCLKKFQVTVATPDDAKTLPPHLSLSSMSRTKPESGVFLNFNFRVAVPKNWVMKDLYVEQRGSFYFNHSADSVLDARMIETVSIGPTLTLIPNLPGLSLTPTYTYFFYRNKIVRNLLEGRTLDIKLVYRFDWKTGASWKQVLRYGRP